jgi:hypothetical protein
MNEDYIIITIIIVIDLNYDNFNYYYLSIILFYLKHKKKDISYYCYYY